MSKDRKPFEADGYLILADLVSPTECEALAHELTTLMEEQGRANPKARGGLRNVLRVSPSAAALAYSQKILSTVGELIGGTPFPVRAILFDKTGDANWGIPWHQDLAIAVVEKVETVGFCSWSVKEGVVQVKPPIEVLAGMLTLRLHLDDCGADNGALRVLPMINERIVVFRPFFKGKVSKNFSGIHKIINSSKRRR